MKRFLPLLLILVSCTNPPPKPTPRQLQFDYAKERPEDLTGRILGAKPKKCACGRTSQQFPVWLKKNYPAWVRYAYDREKENETK